MIVDDQIGYQDRERAVVPDGHRYPEPTSCTTRWAGQQSIRIDLGGDLLWTTEASKIVYLAEQAARVLDIDGHGTGGSSDVEDGAVQAGGCGRDAVWIPHAELDGRPISMGELAVEFLHVARRHPVPVQLPPHRGDRAVADVGQLHLD